MRIIVKLTDGKRWYSEDVTEEEKSRWESVSTNNPDLTSFEDWTRHMKEENFINLDNYNGNHFVFGWLEAFAQSDNIPHWIMEAKSLTIEVINEE